MSGDDALLWCSDHLEDWETRGAIYPTQLISEGILEGIVSIVSDKDGYLAMPWLLDTLCRLLNAIDGYS